MYITEAENDIDENEPKEKPDALPQHIRCNGVAGREHQNFREHFQA